MQYGTEPTESKGYAPRGSNQAGLRLHNERLVLSLIRQRGPLAKADIARASGLSAQAVSVIMRKLESDGLLVKGDPVRGKVGQPSVPMRLAEDGAFFFGLKVGRRSVELVLTDFLGKVLHRAMRTHAYPTPEGTLSFAREMINDILGRLPAEHRAKVAGLGIAMPFFLWNWAENLGVPVQSMAGWRNTDLAAEIAEDVTFPVFVENDASAACGAEVVFGPAQNPQDFLYFYLGYFIGGGIVLNGSVFSGAGNAGAIGPMPVPTRDGVKQLLDVASLSGLEARLIAANGQASGMWQDHEHWQIDPQIFADWVDEAAAGIAHAIVASCVIIDFSRVLIDGWIPRDLCQMLIDAVNTKIDRMDLTGLTRPSIQMGTVGADARTLGAASLPLSEKFLVDANL